MLLVIWPGAPNSFLFLVAKTVRTLSFYFGRLLQETIEKATRQLARLRMVDEVHKMLDAYGSRTSATIQKTQTHSDRLQPNRNGLHPSGRSASQPLVL